MMNARRAHRAGALVFGLIVLGPLASPAQAQWGDMGMGWGWGGFGMRNVPSPTDFVNQHALTRAAQGMQAPRSHNPYANNPNSYFNRIRDNGLVSHYDARHAAPRLIRRIRRSRPVPGPRSPHRSVRPWRRQLRSFPWAAFSMLRGNSYGPTNLRSMAT